MHTALRNLFAPVVFAFVFVANPAYFSGCTSEEEGPTFGEAEMLELLDAANDMGPWPIEASDGSRYEVELVLLQAPGEDAVVRAKTPLFAAQAFACGSRRFMQSASACDSFTELVIEGTLTLRALDAEPRELILDAEVTGVMWVGSNNLTSATIQLQFHEMTGSFSLESDDGRTFSPDSFEAVGLGDEGDVSVRYYAN